MIPSYTIDRSHFEDAPRFLEQSGAYVCTLTHARAVRSSKGGWGVELGVVAQDGAKPRRPLVIWTLSPSGERYFGARLFEALLFCAGFPDGHALRTGPVSFRQWDYDLREEVEAVDQGYPELAGRQVGLLLQRERYLTPSGKEGVRLNVVGAFDPRTRQTAQEKRDGAPAKALEERLARLVDRASSAPQTMSSSAVAGLEEDIPF